jgi:AsmA protein
MKKAFKYGLMGLGGVLILVLALFAYVAATFNPNDYKPQIIKAVKEAKQRDLVLAGDIKLSFFPKLGADLGKVSLSEHKGDKEFAALDSAKVSLALMPLLKKELVVDRIVIDGVRANLVRYKDGKTNFDDLLSKDEKKSEAIKFDIEGVSISNVTVALDDQQAGRKVQLSRLRIESGRLAEKTSSDIKLSGDVQVDKPRTQVSLQLASGVYFDLAGQQVALKNLDARIQGDAAGISGLDLEAKGSVEANGAKQELLADGLQVSVRGRKGKDEVNVKLDLPRLQLTEAKAQADKLQLEAKLKQAVGESRVVLALPALEGNAKAFKAAQLTLEVDGRQGESTIKGKIASPFAGSLETQVFELAKIAGDIGVSNPKLPKGGYTAHVDGSLKLDLARKNLAATLATKLDDSTIKARAGLARFEPPVVDFDVTIDQLDVDKYLPPSQPGQGKAAQAEPETPFDFSALKGLHLNGKVSIGSLKVANIKSSNVRLEVKANNGRLDLAPMSMSLYQGSLSGAAHLDASGATPRLVLKQNLAGIAIGPLLKDVADKDLLEGKGSVSLDVSAQGSTATAMKKALAGKAALDLKDGAIKGINLAQSIRDAKAKLGMKGAQTQAANQNAKTDFSELKATFNIAGGVAHNDDLTMKSPLLRVGGNGDINIGENSMNYLVKATVVGSLEGQGGKDTLKGLTVPVRASGPFDKLSYAIDFGSMAQEAVKQEVKAKAEEKLKDKFKGLLR